MRANLMKAMLAAACLPLMSFAVWAQQQDPPANETGDGSRQQTIAFPTGNRDNSVLLIQTNAPSNARVGEQYTYEIRVTNIAKNVALEDVRIQQRASTGIEIIKIQPDSRRATPERDQEKQREARQPQATEDAKPQQSDDAKEQATEDAKKQESEDAKKQATEDAKPPVTEDSKSQASEDAKSQATEDNQPRNQQEANVWTIGQLMPGETKTAQVTAVGDKEGEVSTCLSVEYNTAICLMTTFVKPELAVEKTAPNEVNVCDAIKYHYTVTNTGSGATGEITLVDPLPEGVRTRDGKQELTFRVDSLAPNQSREFDAEVMASGAGQIGSRAEATTADGLSARSNRPTTKVTEAILSVEALGPNVTSVGETVTYQVTVRNQGDAVAEDTQLSIEVPQGFDVLGASEDMGSQDRGERQDGGQEEEVGQSMRTVQLGDLQPNDQKQFWIRTVAREPGKQLGYNFTATSACDRERVEHQPQRSVVRTEVIAMPALSLVAVDMKDPIKSGDPVTYRIAVTNQGSAVARDVKVVAKLPAELKYEKASGATAAKADGNKVSFDPIPELHPNDKVEWQLVAQTSSPGQIRFRAEVTSELIREPGISMEPTTIYDPEEIDEEVVTPPKATQEPKDTEEPKATEEPKDTQEPKATEEPKDTQEPKATEEPKETDAE
ncbi:MAG: COG1361 family protein [Pirellulaceae bacterium]